MDLSVRTQVLVDCKMFGTSQQMFMVIQAGSTYFISVFLCYGGTGGSWLVVLVQSDRRSKTHHLKMEQWKTQMFIL